MPSTANAKEKIIDESMRKQERKKVQNKRRKRRMTVSMTASHGKRKERGFLTKATSQGKKEAGIYPSGIEGIENKRG